MGDGSMGGGRMGGWEDVAACSTREQMNNVLMSHIMCIVCCVLCVR